MSDKIKIKILSRILLVPYQNTPTEASKILVANPETIAFMEKDGFGLTFEFSLDKFDFYHDPKTQRFYSGDIPEVKIGNMVYIPVLTESETCLEHKEHKNNFKGTKGIFHIHIPASDIEAFFNIGTFALTHSNNWPQLVSIKINQNGQPKRDILGDFLVAFDKLHTNQHLSFTNFPDPLSKGYSSLNPFAQSTLTLYFNYLSSSLPRSYFTYSDDYQLRKSPFKPHCLVRLVETNPKFVRSDDLPEDKIILDFEVPLSEYDGVICNLDKDLNGKQFVSLVPPTAVDWQMMEGKRYFAADILDVYQYLLRKESYQVENMNCETYTLLPPYGEGLSLEFRFYDPSTQRWTKSIYGLTDKTGTDIVFDAKARVWKSEPTTIWDDVKERSLTSEEQAVFDKWVKAKERALTAEKKAMLESEKPYFDLKSKIVLGVNKNFSVMCTYKQTATISESYGLVPPEETKNGLVSYDSTNPLNRCVPLIHYIPEAKMQRTMWSSAINIYIQQSTFGVYTNYETCTIVRLNENNQIVEKFDKDEHLGSPFIVDGKAFREGKIAIVLGPNTARLDISPELHSSPCRNELHTVLAGGYDKKTTLGSKINY